MKFDVKLKDAKKRICEVKIIEKGKVYTMKADLFERIPLKCSCGCEYEFHVVGVGGEIHICDCDELIGGVVDEIVKDE